ncbi:MAG: 23S rRNA (guanosine(2251)-2'-O)-methyltransferase RlmB [Bacteroidota bacterium]
MESRKMRGKASPANMVYGTRAIIESLSTDREIERVLIQKGIQNELISSLTRELSQQGIPFSRVPLEKLNRLTKKNHQGAIAFISPIIYQNLDNIISQVFESGKNPLILVLDRVTDVRNFGAIARTAECAGVDAIVIPAKGGAQINADAVKTSAGGLNHIPICREDNLKSTLDYLKNSGLKVVACTEKADKNLYDIELSQPLAVLMGSEEDGISRAYLDKSDEQVFIPMFGKIDSLNVSVSTAVILYEAIRQRSD